MSQYAYWDRIYIMSNTYNNWVIAKIGPDGSGLGFWWILDNTAHARDVIMLNHLIFGQKSCDLYMQKINLLEKPFWLCMHVPTKKCASNFS